MKTFLFTCKRKKNPIFQHFKNRNRKTRYTFLFSGDLITRVCFARSPLPRLLVHIITRLMFLSELFPSMHPHPPWSSPASPVSYLYNASLHCMPLPFSWQPLQLQSLTCFPVSVHIFNSGNTLVVLCLTLNILSDSKPSLCVTLSLNPSFINRYGNL